jgi:soluble lytic murein transglycosylase-like protein
VIEDAVRRYWIDLPLWRLWKAQLYQESRLDARACSAAGACGIAQFMPQTWTNVARQLTFAPDASRFDAELAIAAGAYYQARLRHAWSREGRSGLDRNDLGAASYNAGLGNVIAAQRRCADAVLWAAIAPCLPAVTGAHAQETNTYVANIRRWWRMMEAE